MRRPMVFVLLAGLAAMLASVMVYSALKRREAEVQNAMSHNVQVVMEIDRWVAVGRYECDNAAQRQAIRRSRKGETTMLISEK